MFNKSACETNNAWNTDNVCDIKRALESYDADVFVVGCSAG